MKCEVPLFLPTLPFPSLSRLNACLVCQPSVFSTLLHTLDFTAVLGVVQEARETYSLALRDYR